MNAKKAFTLIELLVVIAIIAILAAILFPVFAQAKAAAKNAVSVSNMKQIGLGLAMYEGDADDVLPLGRVYGPTGNIGLPVLLGPYIQKIANKASGDTAAVSNATIWHSPLDSVAPKSFTFTATATSPLVKQTYEHIYWTSGGIDRAPWFSDVANENGDGGGHQNGKSATIFGAPANTFLIVESTLPSLVLGGNNAGIKRPWDPNTNNSSYPQAGAGTGDYVGQDCNVLGTSDTNCAGVIKKSYPTGLSGGGGWNYLFADAHVKNMKPTATIGTGVNGTGMDKDGHVCNALWPCGPWTVDDQD